MSFFRALWPKIENDQRKKAVVYEYDRHYFVDNEYASQGVAEGWLTLIGWERINGELVGRYEVIDLLDLLSDFE